MKLIQRRRLNLLTFLFTVAAVMLSVTELSSQNPSVRSEVNILEKKRNKLEGEYEKIRTSEDVEKRGELLYKIGQINVELGDVNRLDRTLDQLSNLSRRTGDVLIQAKLVDLESEFFRLKGLYRLSLESYKNYVLLQDTIATLRQQQALAAMAEENKQDQSRIRQEQLSTLKIYALALGVSLIIALIFLAYGMYKRKKIEGLNIHMATLLSEYVGSYSSKLTDPSYSRQVIHEVHSDEEISVEGLTDEIVVKILDGLKRFEEEKKYLKLDCTINDVAEFINTNKTYLSKVINVVKKKPFTNYVNELRLIHAIQLLKSKDYKKYTIKAISKEAGFKSKSTFNSAFKEYTGLTPSEFLKSIEQD